VKAKKRVAFVADLLEEIGLGRDRIRMVNMSSAMGTRFAEVAAEMDTVIKTLGPSPLRVKPQAQPSSEGIPQPPIGG
jgi:coenzyme F420-reducing hydrogenase delta subunit